jgi:hypothetical protein
VGYVVEIHKSESITKRRGEVPRRFGETLRV